MKKGPTLILAGLLAASCFLVMVGPLAAQSTKTPIDMWEVSCLVHPGVEWIAGDVLHVRGRMSQTVLYESESFTVVGSDAIVSNANLDAATMSGVLFGTWSVLYLPASTTDTFDGRWRAEMTGGVAAIGTAVGLGTGELRGMKMKLNLVSDPSSPPPTGLLMVLGVNPPCDPAQIIGIIHLTGFIRSPAVG